MSSGRVSCPEWLKCPAERDPRCRLLKACATSNVELLRQLVSSYQQDILLVRTPYLNTALHLAVMTGNEIFAEVVWSKEPSLFSETNMYEETPLIVALMAGNKPLASSLISAATNLLHPLNTSNLEAGNPFVEMLLMFDMRGDNALHHALRNGLPDLALDQLLKTEHVGLRLSKKVNKNGESPMHIACRRGYLEVVSKLLEWEESSDVGPQDTTAMHAAVVARQTDIVKELLVHRPKLAYRVCNGHTALTTAILTNNLEIVNLLLNHDPVLAYIYGNCQDQNCDHSPIILAAGTGNVKIAEALIQHCPDSAYYSLTKGCKNALHHAIDMERPQMINYLLYTPQFQRLINEGDSNGGLPLHHAAEKCQTELLRSLLSHHAQDHTAVDNTNRNAVDKVCGKTNLFKTFKWNEAFTVLSNKIPSGTSNWIGYRVNMEMKRKAEDEVKSLTEKYISNTSLVAALLATITFAAAFTLPGGYSSGSDNTGLAVFARKAAFQVFLVSDTVAMCSSLAVAFLGVLATWEDLDFFLNYRTTTKILMWCAYVATLTAFATGLYTVVAGECLWLAVLTVALCGILPFFSKLLGDWPIFKLQFRLGRLFRRDLIPQI